MRAWKKIRCLRSLISMRAWRKDKMTGKLDINESLEEDKMTENLDDENVDGVHRLQSSDTKLFTEGDHGTISTSTEGFKVVKEVSVETSVIVSEAMVSGEVGQQELQKHGESKPELTSASDIGSQVLEVCQVKSDSISLDTMSVTEKNDLNDNVIAVDDVKLEPNVKPEMSFSNVVCDDGKTELVVVDDIVTTKEKDVSIAVSITIFKRNDSGDVGSPAKLNLDRSSGDDSMEEDAFESKQIDSIGEITKAPLVREGDPVGVMVEDSSAAKITESTKDKNDTAAGSTKRKLHDQEAATNSVAVKRQCKRNSQQQTTDSSVPTTPKDAFQAPMRHRFLKSDSSVNHEEPKERVVPPSSKPPTTSLRIDRFASTICALPSWYSQSWVFINRWNRLNCCH